MVITDSLNKDYFEWLYELVCAERFAQDISFRKVLMHMYDTEFIYTIPKDGNRAEDGKDLRRRFAGEPFINYLDGPCNVLEMMVALAIRCEETIMDDPSKGDRTGQWFWGMFVNLGLGSMTDDMYDRHYVTRVLDDFLHRDYAPDGRGGLFKIKNCTVDLRDVEIWTQLCWYLDGFS